ncbi:MAG TPA: hypothetical protein VFX28_12305, partial [Methylomirabilota bacterium]|nr:hypothetical protein [Methylomirabilota bacterium]
WRDAVAGVSSVAAMTCRVLEAAERLGGESQVVMLRAGLACSRIIREDMGLYDTTHGDLYERLATAVCGDGEWRAARYRVPGAQAFHEWQRQERQRGPDLEAGLIRTVVTEIYNYGEFELVAPLFRRWLGHVPGVAAPDQALEYLVAHLGDTESRHFLSIVEAHRLYCQALGTPLDYARVQLRCEEFLDRVGAKYAALSEAVIEPDLAPVGS